MVILRALRSISNPISSETTGGQPAAYICDVGCGIGLGVAIVFGISALSALWVWYWVSRPMPDSPEECEAEKSRLYFLTGQHVRKAKGTSWPKRASLAAKAVMAPLNPGLQRVHLRDDNPEARAGLTNHVEPFGKFEQSHPSMTPLSGSFQPSNLSLVPAPLAVRSRQLSTEEEAAITKRNIEEQFGCSPQ